MKNFSRIVLLLMTLSVSTSFGSIIQKQIEKAVYDNRTAKSLIQWDNSSSHPNRLFLKWQKQANKHLGKNNRIGSEICRSLETLDSVSLTIFENEINDKANENLISDCQLKLTLRLEGHHRGQKKGTWGAEINTFEFPDNEQLRDTRNGYFAVTGDVGPKEVVLTFDDGPSPYTDTIVEALDKVNAKATFFMLGKNVRLQPGRVKKLAASGHVIGSHSVNHYCLGDSSHCEKTNGRLLSFSEAVKEIRDGHQAIYDVLGYVDPFFRFPYGEYSKPLAKFLNDNSVANFYWSIDSQDWRAQTNENLLNNLMKEIEKKGRGIVLFHDIQRKTAEIMPSFLRSLYYRGYSVVLLKSSDPNAKDSRLVRKIIP